jgi:tetratricopeptide (TPR) repeat protein
MKIRKLLAITVLVLSSFAASNVAPSKAELEAMYDKAFREFDSNNFPEALKQLDAIDARQPDLAESQNLRGVILMREGIYDKAEGALHEALRIDPKFWNARFNLAEIPFLKKDWVEARNRFQDLLTNNVAELRGDASQLIQYKILLTYLLEGKENMVDSILAKFELSPDTPAVHYANAAIALQHKNSKEAKDWISAAEKNFSPQLNKLFAESLYEVGWLEKQAGQTRPALEITSATERAAKTKAFARSRYEQAQQAFQQRDFTTARKFIDEADTADPNQPSILNLRGEVLTEQKEFDQAEITFKKAAKLDPKFREAQYNLAQIPFKKKDYAKARERFETLFSQTPGGDKNQASQLIKFKIFMTLLLEGKDSRAQKMMEQFQFTGDTPALYYAQAAWEFKHNNPNKATDWIASAKKIYSPALNVVFGDAFYDLGWMQSPGMAGSPAPAAEAAAVMSAQTEASPAIEPSPIPGTTVASKGRQAIASASPAATIAGMEATTSHVPASPAAAIQAPVLALNNSIAAGTPANPEDIPPNAAPALSPTVETTMPATAPSSSIVPSANLSSEAKPPVPARSSAPVAQANTPAPTPPVVAAVSATPATLLAPSHVRETSGPTMAERLGRLLPDGRTSLVVALVLAGVALLAWVIVPIIPEVRRRLANMPVYRRPVPASGPMMDNGNGETSAQKIMPHRFVGGPRQVSLKLRASEPALRRSVRPLSKPTGAGRPFNVAPVVSPVATFTPAVVEPVIAPVPESQFDVVSPVAETAFESAVGSVIEQGGTAMEADQPMPAEEVSFPSVAESFADSESSTWTPEMPVEQVSNSQASEPAVEAEPELEPIGQGEPVPFEMPVFEQEFAAPIFTQEPVVEVIETETVEVAPVAPTQEPVAEVIEAETVEVAPAAPAEFMADEPVVESVAFSEPEISSFVPPVASTEPSVLQTTIPEIMPEPIQMQNAPVAPVVRTPATGGPSQSPNAMHTAVQLTFSFEIASMQLTPSFKMGALQLRPTSKIVTMRLASSQQPQPAMNLQVTFEISKIQPSGGGLGTVRLSPSQQQRPTVVGSPSFTVGGMQLVSNFESAPVQLTPSQQATVMVTGSFQIATVEFSPSFEIASIVLNSTAKQVAVALPGAGSVEGAPMFEIANLQLGANGEIGMMQLTMLGQGQRR